MSESAHIEAARQRLRDADTPVPDAHDEYAADEYDLYVQRRAGDLIPLERERIELLLRSGT